jgi:hypothetical protein
MCRAPFTPDECLEIFKSTQVDPLMRRFYKEIPAHNQEASFKLIDKIITIISRTCRVIDMDILDGHFETYERAVDTIADQVNTREDLNEMLLDVVMMGSRAVDHLADNRTYNGFAVIGEDHTLYTDMALPTPFANGPPPPSAPLAPNGLPFPVPVPVPAPAPVDPRVIVMEDVIMINEWARE